MFGVLNIVIFYNIWFKNREGCCMDENVYNKNIDIDEYK